MINIIIFSSFVPPTVTAEYILLPFVSYLPDRVSVRVSESQPGFTRNLLNIVHLDMF